MILDKTASIARLTQSSSNSNKESYVTVPTLSIIGINIQPASPQLIAVSEGVYGETYQAFTSVGGIKVGDQITVSGIAGNYIVKGVQDWQQAPIPHLELVLFRGEK